MTWFRIRRRQAGAWTTWHLAGPDALSVCHHATPNGAYRVQATQDTPNHGAKICGKCIQEMRRVAETQKAKALLR